ncbi:DUF881 domain-containing protein [Nocardioides sp. SOB77]|uniref:DUF881 domain-containing protein n=1 Tax=Nocardioides oceani TaxID=3058369 RepID=A0ABT8FC19_9ACTN|nr:DUF881 domain-containing protein [Nocardioides oceani]MDN4172238.1 DUF881 domain-containing protein [Nocardioides oceani]
MTSGSHARPEEHPPRRWADRLRRPRGRATLGWRIGTPVMVVLSGALFVTSAENSAGTDLRPGRYTDLASLVEAEADQYDALAERASDLDAEVDRLAGTVSDVGVTKWRRQADELRDPAGLAPRRGAGVRITLSDAPAEVVDAQPADADINEFLVHQQDIQAVVNALWRGGATAVTIAGQRVITTTGIKCEGNAVTLHGVPYPQPYVIEAVGDPGGLQASIGGDDYVAAYLDAVARGAVGWELDVEDDVVAPAYEGVLTMSYAEPLD